MRTKSYKSIDIEEKWHLVDAEDKTLGRLSAKVSSILMGKNKAQYTPNSNLGDYVVIINAEKIKVTGQKETQKTYSFKLSGNCFKIGKIINFVVKLH